MKTIIKWRNKYSGETGYVERVSEKEHHFVNTVHKGNAKEYSTEAAAKGVITKLTNWGEAQNNIFDLEIIDVGGGVVV